MKNMPILQYKSSQKGIFNRPIDKTLSVCTRLHEKAKKTGGLRSRVNAYCAYCIYDHLAPGSWRRQVSECTDINCPFHDVRPRAKKSGDQHESREIGT